MWTGSYPRDPRRQVGQSPRTAPTHPVPQETLVKWVNEWMNAPKNWIRISSLLTPQSWKWVPQNIYRKGLKSWFFRWRVDSIMVICKVTLMPEAGCKVSGSIPGNSISQRLNSALVNWTYRHTYITGYVYIHIRICTHTHTHIYSSGTREHNEIAHMSFYPNCSATTQLTIKSFIFWSSLS